MRRVGLPRWRALLLIALSVPAWSGFARADDPPKPDAKPKPLARYFPGADLVAYLEFDGIEAHSAAWKATATGKILDETPTGDMLRSLARQAFAGISEVDGFEKEYGEYLIEAVDLLVRNGFAFAINRPKGGPDVKPTCVGMVLRGAAKTKAWAKLTDIKAGVETVDKPGGRKVRVLGPAEGPCVAFWTEGDDIACGILRASHADAMIACLDGKTPNAVEHPLRRELAATVDGFEPVGFGFLDATALPEMPPEAATFGLDGIKRIDVRWGYQGEALVCESRIVAPSPRRGALAMFDQPGFDSKTLPPLPEGVGSFTVVSLDLVKLYDQVAAMAKEIDPTIGEKLKMPAPGTPLASGVTFTPDPTLMPALERLEAAFKAKGWKFREDFLAQVGPRFVFADVPVPVYVSSNKLSGFVREMARVPRTSVLFEIRDRPKFLERFEVVANWVNAESSRPADPKARPASPLVRRLKGPDHGYEIALSPTYWPLPAGYRPSIVVGEKYAAIGTTPDVARKALKGSAGLAGPLARAMATLPPNLTVLTVDDTANSATPELLANIPSASQWIALLITGTKVNGVPVFSSGFPTPNVTPPAPAVEMPVAPAPVPGVPATPPTPAEPDASSPQPRVLPSPSSPPPSPVGPTTRVQLPGAPAAPVAVEIVQEAAPVAAADEDFRFRFDPDEIPTPDEIRTHLFPATYSMSVDDQGFRFRSRESFPSWNPISLAPIAVAAALPAFQAWRADKEKERAGANLRKVGLALAVYESQNGHFPPASIKNDDGKPLLGWRVELLPSLGEKELYDEFHRDEPWDSPHNKALLPRMPAAFAHPDAKAEPGMTYYRGASGKHAFFDPEVEEGVTIASITDGTSNTLAVVEAREAVPWTKPGTEIPVGEADLLKLLGGHSSGGFQGLFVDGSVRLLRESVAIDTLRALLSRDQGEVVAGDSY